MRWAHPGADDASPADAPGESACEYESQGLAAALGGAAPEANRRILDLGAASGSSLEVYARFVRVVRFADLARELGFVPSGGASLTAAALDRILPPGDSYDVVLAWDLLGRLSREGCSALMSRLAVQGAPGMRLLAVDLTAPELAGVALRFRLTGGWKVRCEPLRSGVRGGPDLAPAEMARRLAPFVVEHSLLLASGVREYLAVLR